MTNEPLSAEALFQGKDAAVYATYRRLLAALEQIGPFTEDSKKTSIHLVKTTAFAGVHPRKSHLYLNIRTAQPLSSGRVHKTEQVSKNRYHNEVKLTAPDEVDAELIGWLSEAYALG
jgi:hypothetical protein